MARQQPLMANRHSARSLIWLQLVFCFLLASSTVYGYFAYRLSLGQLIDSLSASISAVSTVVGTTAETVEARKDFILVTRQALVATRGLIKELKTTALHQTSLAPQYAEDLRRASTLMVRIGEWTSLLSDQLMFSVPTKIEMDGLRPIIVMTRPLGEQGQSMKAIAPDIKALGASVLNLSSAVANDGAKLGAALTSTSEQSIRLLDETEKTLDRLQENDLPKALKEMKSTSENLRTVSQQVNVAGSIGTVFLAFGLLISGWCFINSLSQLMMEKSHYGDAVNRIKTNASSRAEEKR